MAKVMRNDDIRNIRYDNYEKTKDLPITELIEKKEAAFGWARLIELKQDKRKSSQK